MNYQSLQVTEADFARPYFPFWLAEQVERVRAINEEAWIDARLAQKRKIANAVLLYGAGSLPARYLYPKPIPTPPNLARQEREINHDYRLWLDEQARRERREANRIKREARQKAECEAQEDGQP